MKRSAASLILFILLSFGWHPSEASGANIEDTPIKFSLPAGWTLGEVTGITRRPNGHFILYHRGQHQLLEFDENRQFLRELGEGLFANPHGLRIDHDGNVWVTDTGTHLVYRFAPSGELTMVLGKNGVAGTGWFDRDYNLVLFDQPMDVAIDKRGHIYVVDKGNARIVKLNADGFMINSWGRQGSGIAEFNFAHSIVIDDQERIYIADRENKRIQIFDTDGNPLGQWDHVGYPYVLAINNNTIWMTDARAEQVKQFDLDGTFLQMHQGDTGRNHGQYSAVHGLHVGEAGRVWVTQIFNWSGVNRLHFDR